MFIYTSHFTYNMNYDKLDLTFILHRNIIHLNRNRPSKKGQCWTSSGKAEYHVCNLNVNCIELYIFNINLPSLGRII